MMDYSSRINFVVNHTSPKTDSRACFLRLHSRRGRGARIAMGWCAENHRHVRRRATIGDHGARAPSSPRSTIPRVASRHLSTSFTTDSRARHPHTHTGSTLCHHRICDILHGIHHPCRVDVPGVSSSRRSARARRRARATRTHRPSRPPRRRLRRHITATSRVNHHHRRRRPSSCCCCTHSSRILRIVARTGSARRVHPSIHPSIHPSRPPSPSPTAGV